MATDTTGLMNGLRDFARQRASDIADEFINQARSFAPRRTGAGADSITVDSIDESGSTFRMHITVGEIYMRYQNDGTGLYGPNHIWIMPYNARALVFEGIGGLVFATRVRGTEPTHWWERTLDQWPNIVRSA